MVNTMSQTFTLKWVCYTGASVAINDPRTLQGRFYKHKFVYILGPLGNLLLYTRRHPKGHT